MTRASPLFVVAPRTTSKTPKAIVPALRTNSRPPTAIVPAPLTTRSIAARRRGSEQSAPATTSKQLAPAATGVSDFKIAALLAKFGRSWPKAK